MTETEKSKIDELYFNASLLSPSVPEGVPNDLSHIKERVEVDLEFCQKLQTDEMLRVCFHYCVKHSDDGYPIPQQLEEPLQTIRAALLNRGQLEIDQYEHFKTVYKYTPLLFIRELFHRTFKARLMHIQCHLACFWRFDADIQAIYEKVRNASMERVDLTQPMVIPPETR